MERALDQQQSGGGAVQRGLGAVGVFRDAVRCAASELMELEDAAVAKDWLARVPADVREAVLRWVECERVEAGQQEKLRSLNWVSYVLSYALFPATESKAWGVVYALDLEHIHCGVSPAQRARKLNLTRAALSHAMEEAARVLQVPPSRWMRSEKSVARSAASVRRRVGG